MNFKTFCLRENLELISIDINQSDFGTSYSSSLGPSSFLNIIFDNNKVGEIEYSKKGDILEVISIYLDKSTRGKGLGKKSVNLLFSKFNLEKMIFKVAPSAKKFWLAMGAIPIKGKPSFYEILKR